MSIRENPTYIIIMRAQYKINFDRPPRLKKLPEALIISPELRHLYKQTDRNSQIEISIDYT